jgi:energy-coupling factor transporter ATP-binding protein EcfA2
VNPKHLTDTMRLSDEAASSLMTLEEAYVLAKREWIDPPAAVKFELLPMLTGLIGGMRPKEFTILCGPTGSGKSSLLAVMSASMLITRDKHLVASVETGYEDFVRRVSSVLTNEDMNTGERVSEQKLARFERSYDFILKSGDLLLSRIDNRMSLEFMVEKLRYAVSVGCKVALMDNLNFFMEITRSSEAIVEMDRVVHELIMFCKTNPIHIVMVMHPKKTDGGRVTSEFDIKGSSTAVQESHNVLLFNRVTEEMLQEGFLPTHREIKIAKLRRNGRAVGRTVIIDGSTPRYVECEIR